MTDVDLDIDWKIRFTVPEVLSRLRPELSAAERVAAADEFVRLWRLPGTDPEARSVRAWAHRDAVRTIVTAGVHRKDWLIGMATRLPRPEAYPSPIEPMFDFATAAEHARQQGLLDERAPGGSTLRGFTRTTEALLRAAPTGSGADRELPFWAASTYVLALETVEQLQEGTGHPHERVAFERLMSRFSQELGLRGAAGTATWNAIGEKVENTGLVRGDGLRPVTPAQESPQDTLDMLEGGVPEALQPHVVALRALIDRGREDRGNLSGYLTEVAAVNTLLKSHRAEALRSGARLNAARASVSETLAMAWDLPQESAVTGPLPAPTWPIDHDIERGFDRRTGSPEAGLAAAWKTCTALVEALPADVSAYLVEARGRIRSGLGAMLSAEPTLADREAVESAVALASELQTRQRMALELATLKARLGVEPATGDLVAESALELAGLPFGQSPDSPLGRVGAQLDTVAHWSDEQGRRAAFTGIMLEVLASRLGTEPGSDPVWTRVTALLRARPATDVTLGLKGMQGGLALDAAAAVQQSGAKGVANTAMCRRRAQGPQVDPLTGWAT